MSIINHPNERGDILSSKLEQVVEYIANLEIGTKVSIKSLAKSLSVSEGTAYHAIKRAEQQELVVTLPKAGTTRVQKKDQPAYVLLTIKTLMDLIDAVMLTSPSTSDVVLNQFYVGDTNVEDLRRQLEAGNDGAVCILGDRPEMQRTAVAGGANLLLTGGAQPCEDILFQAEREHLVILRTEHSTFHVLNRLNSAADNHFPFPVQVRVQEWMQPPQFLYLDDLVADGRKIFQDYGLKEIPVVDEDMHICGILSAAKALGTEVSQRVRRVYENGGTYQAVQDTDYISVAAAQFVFRGGNQVFVLKEDRLEGMLTANDLLKVFQYYGASAGQQNQEYLLQLVTSQEQNSRHIYSVRLPFSKTQDHTIYGNHSMSLLLSAANHYCQELGIHGSVQNLTFYSGVPGAVVGDLNLSVELVSQSVGHYALECEVYSDVCSYAKASFLILPE